MIINTQQERPWGKMKKDRSVIPEAMSAKEAADTAALPSVLEGAADKRLHPAAV